MNTQYFDLVNSPLKGTNLIEASAGTGKTYIIAGLFLRLILEKGIPADSILTVTFTEAATEELRYRIRERLKDAFNALAGGGNLSGNDELSTHIAVKYKKSETALWRLRDALTRFDESSICTIHGFCKRMLFENAFESSSLFDAELVTDQTNLIREIIDDFWRKNFYSASKMFLQYIINKNINVSYFYNLNKYFSIDPSFEIIPKIKKPDTAKPEAQLFKAFKKLQKEWHTNKKIIEDIFTASRELSGTKYGRKAVNWIIEMDDYLSSDNPVAIFEKFWKFTASSVNDSVNKGFSAPQNIFFNQCEDFLQIHNEAIAAYDQYRIFLESELFGFVKSEANNKKHKLNIVTFDDLLLNAYAAIGQGKNSALAKAARERYKAALVDEFQDTDPVQYGILNSIFGSGSILFLIGDPKQSIYKFRGADIFAYLKASGNIKSRYTLESNWRSSPELIRAVNTVFGNRQRPFVFRDIDFNPVKPGNPEEQSAPQSSFNICLIGKDNGNKKDGLITKGRASGLVANSVAGEIFNLVTEGEKNVGTVRPGDIAVLVRKNIQSRLIQRELRKFGIPGVIYGSESVFASREAIETERVIACACNPGDERLLKAALTTSMTGLNGNDIFALAENETAAEAYINKFYAYHDLWEGRGFFRMFMRFIESERVRERLLSYIDGERRMTNLMHLAELLHTAESENKLGMEELVQWLKEKIVLADESAEYEVRLESDDNAVNIITIHRSKGLEFPVTFCPFLWDSSEFDNKKLPLFHYHNNNLTLDLAADEKNKSLAETEELAENTRLLYVALTRAKHSAYFYWGKINETETSATAYLFHNKDKDLSLPVSGLKKNAKLQNYESMMEDISELAKASDGAIRVMDLPQYEYCRRAASGSSLNEVNCRAFSGSIKNDWKISSFSFLTHDTKENSESPDHDHVDNMYASGQIRNDKDRNIFSFPKGAIAGTCIHEIFEKIDFAYAKEEPSKKIITETLVKYGIDEDWRDILSIMANAVLTTPLSRSDSDFMLKNIQQDERLSELEFFFPLDLISSKGLAEVFLSTGIVSDNNFIASLEMLRFKPHKGFVKGYIDLVFQHKEKYYIVDWKSNHLGNNIEDYSGEAIKSAMEKNYYILQYYIYAVALHRYLLSRKSGYNYNKHFGGIFYMFVRGADIRQPMSGMYFDMPSIETINSLSNYFSASVMEAAL
ncbi:MAG: exodeoxyribonuclease V subunit beta [Spirochaetota bacterium]